MCETTFCNIQRVCEQWILCWRALLGKRCQDGTSASSAPFTCREKTFENSLH